jgi:hypothetical protein
MRKLMFLHITLLIECSITHITSIRTLASMYTLVSFQVILCIECLITHVTD